MQAEQQQNGLGFASAGLTAADFSSAGDRDAPLNLSLYPQSYEPHDLLKALKQLKNRKNDVRHPYCRAFPAEQESGARHGADHARPNADTEAPEPAFTRRARRNGAARSCGPRPAPHRESRPGTQRTRTFTRGPGCGSQNHIFHFPDPKSSSTLNS